jgi:hypothetical protein
MEKPKVSSDMRGLLDDLRLANRYLSVYDLEPATVEQAVLHVCRPMLDAVGLPQVLYNQYIWFLSELSRCFRTLRGRGLAMALEALLVKWPLYRLDPELLEVLIGCCCEALPAAEESSTRTTKPSSGDAGADWPRLSLALSQDPGLSPTGLCPSAPAPLEPSPEAANAWPG